MPSAISSNIPRADSYARHRAVLYRELYSFLTASTGGSDRPAPASATDLPRPLARSLVHFYSLLRRSTIHGLDHSLADQVALAIAGWFASLWEDLQASAPMEDLIDERPGSEDPSPDTLEEHLDAATRHWPEERDRWETLRRQLDLAGTDYHRRAVLETFVEERRRVVGNRRDLRRERALRLVASPLADHLNETVPKLCERQARVKEIFGAGGHWDVLNSQQGEIRWSVLTRWEEYLLRAPRLKELCAVLARGTDTRPPGEVETEREVPVTIREERDRGLGEVTGLSRGTGMTGTILSDLGLLAFPATEDLFARKYVEGALLHLRHERAMAVQRVTSRTITERTRRKRARGRIILCVDTSGSMRGTPERVARATVLGVLREALLSNRPATVILQSDKLHVLETGTPPPAEDHQGPMTGSSPPAVPESLIDQIIRLLEDSFTDGTDAAPAMEKGLSILEGSDPGTTTDLVVISDTRFPRIPPRHLNRVYNLQSSDRLRLHSLTIHEEPIEDPLNVFDYRWFFNTAPRSAFGESLQDEPVGVEMHTVRGF